MQIQFDGSELKPLVREIVREVMSATEEAGPAKVNAPDATDQRPLLLNSRDAAKLLGICERTLWTLTDKGEITAVRLGERTLRYHRPDLEHWVEKKKTRPTLPDARHYDQ